MRYFLLFTIALCSMNLYSQEALHTWGQETPCD